jgi:RNA methyltransferase, TrmH family
MPIKEITSTANPIIKEIKALEMRKKRKETGLFLAEGLRTILEGVELNVPLKYLIYHHDQKNRSEVKRAQEHCNLHKGLCLEVNQQVLEKLSHKDNPQSVLGVFEQKFYSLKDLDHLHQKTIVVLEQVRDPGNLGTIIRTIDSVGADAVILIDQCCDPYSIEATRATMGSIFSVPILLCSFAEFADWSKNYKARRKGTLIGTTLQSAKDFREIKPQQLFCLVMGNEQAGLTDKMRDLLDENIKLPMNGRADSLNLSVATGIMLYALLEPWN